MALQDVSPLLIDAPVGRHFAQFHRDPADLAESVARFVEQGLRRTGSVVVIATPVTTNACVERLAVHSVDADWYCSSGQLSLLDAEAILGKFMRHGLPDWLEFRRALGAILEKAQAPGSGPTRAYGEMVNILWQEGRTQAAIMLEDYWNELAKTYSFSLFCGYLIDSHDHQAYHAPIHEIGRTHTDIIAAEEEERFRDALDAASRELCGISLTQTISLSAAEDRPGEHRLPAGHRTMLWLMRHMPASSAQLLELARQYYQRVPLV